MRTTSFLSKRQLSPRPVLAAFSLTLSSRVSFTFLRSLSRSEARAESSNVVFAQMNQAARAYPFPSCRRQSFFIRFNGSVLFLHAARRTQEFATWINDEARESDAHMLAPGGPPTRRDLASDTFPPPPSFGREALRASAHSLCHLDTSTFFLFLPTVVSR